MARESHRMVITPRGITLSRGPGETLWHQFFAALQRTAMLVGWNLRKRAFGKSTGPLFLVIEPAMQALLYFYIVFVVFGVRGSDVSYVSLFTSVSIWRGHAMIAGSGPYNLVGHASILQQSRYSPIALIAEDIATETALFSLTLVIVLAILVVAGYGPHWNWLLFPLLIAVQILFSSGCAILLACLGVYVRETSLVANFTISIWMYASPVVYDMQRLPEPLRTIVLLTNPFAHLMPAHRQLLLHGELPPMIPLMIVLLLSIALLWLGIRWVEATRARLYRYL